MIKKYNDKIFAITKHAILILEEVMFNTVLSFIIHTHTHKKALTIYCVHYHSTSDMVRTATTVPGDSSIPRNAILISPLYPVP